MSEFLKALNNFSNYELTDFEKQALELFVKQKTPNLFTKKRNPKINLASEKDYPVNPFSEHVFTKEQNPEIFHHWSSRTDQSCFYATENQWIAWGGSIKDKEPVCEIDIYGKKAKYYNYNQIEKQC